MTGLQTREGNPYSVICYIKNYDLIRGCIPMSIPIPMMALLRSTKPMRLIQQ